MASPPDPHRAVSVSGEPAPVSAPALTTTDLDFAVSAHPLTGVSAAWLAGEPRRDAEMSGEHCPALTELLTADPDERAAAVAALTAERFRYRSPGARTRSPRLDERPEIDTAHELGRSVAEAPAPVHPLPRRSRGHPRDKEDLHVDGR